jgi:hypothetical protein
MPDERGLHRRRQHCHAVFVALGAVHHDLVAGEIDVLDTQAAALEHPET